MSTTRITGKWDFLLSTIDIAGAKVQPAAEVAAQLDIRIANRAGLEGRMHVGSESVEVRGRVKPGAPSVVSFEEVTEEGEPLDGGLDAMLFIPPWRPNLDYDFDLICGTIVIGESSGLQDERLRNQVIMVAGVQPFE